jgi:hypothetical protein
MRTVHFATLGVPATVVPTEGAPVATRLIWLTPGQAAQGGDFRRAGAKRGVALRRDEVPFLERGTRFSIDSDGSEWKVDSIDRVEDGHIRAIVVPA